MTSLADVVLRIILDAYCLRASTYAKPEIPPSLLHTDRLQAGGRCVCEGECSSVCRLAGGVCVRVSAPLSAGWRAVCCNGECACASASSSPGLGLLFRLQSLLLWRRPRAPVLRSFPFFDCHSPQFIVSLVAISSPPNLKIFSCCSHFLVNSSSYRKGEDCMS